ncbi:phage tail tape measure protein [Haloterrigena sp. SYSU A558-1]|uniref:Phage tail tape measure protein n=1 Tax=Haloterrigena gelatinilytica TaxID=2741724 RepID=A0ABX2LF26_9EURY|nr:phage tail tape measure protein [Haloterrigena gelatinilytica]NUC71714.1 phage tail tape measure protein [Haloterrigena gelatinilytica]
MGALSELRGSIEIDHSGAKSAIEDVQGQAEDMGSSFESTGQRMQSAGKSMTAGVTAPLAAMGGAAAKTAADFEKSMQSSIAIMGDVSNAEREKLEKTAREVATSTSKSHEEAANSYYYLASAGLDAADSMEAMPQVAALAEAGQMDMAEATDIATDTMSAFGMEASELSRVTDTMAGTVNRHNQTMQGMGSAMSQVAPVASGLGMSIEETSAAIGMMGDVGIKAEKAGTGLRSALSSLQNPTGKAAETIEALGIKVNDAEGNMLPLHEIIGQLEESGAKTADIMALFGNQAGPAMQALVDQGSDALRDEAEALSELDGETQKVAETQRDTLHGSIEMLKSSVADLAIEFGSVLTPYIRQAANLATNLADRFSGLGRTTQTVIVAVGGVAAALGPLLIAFGALIGPLSTAVGTLGGLTAVLGPVTGLVGSVIAPLSSLTAIVSGLLAPLTGLVGTMGSFGAAVVGVLGPIGLLVAAIGGIGYVLSENREVVRKFANQAIGKLKSVASGAATWLEANGPSLLKSAFRKIGEGIRFIALDIYNAVTGNGDSIIKSMIIDAGSWLINEGPGILKAAAKLAFDAIMAAAKGLYQGLIGNSLIPEMFQAIGAYIKSTAVSLIQTAIQTLVTRVTTLFTTLKTKTVTTITNWGNRIGTLATNAKNRVVTSVTNLKNRTVTLVTGLKNQTVTQFTNLKNRVTSSITNAKNTVVATATNLKTQTISQFTNLKNTATSRVTSLKDDAVSAITTLKDDTVGELRSMADDAVDEVSEMASDLLDEVDIANKFKNAGGDLISSFADGIRNSVGEATSAVSGAVDDVKSYLPSSPADRGPLSGDEWIYGLPEAMISGMEDRVRELSSASAMIADAARPDPDAPNVPMPTPQPAGGNGRQSSRRRDDERRVMIDFGNLPRDALVSIGDLEDMADEAVRNRRRREKNRTA